MGIAAQPDWLRDDDFIEMGRPRLGVLVGAGNLDSMLGKLTASKKHALQMPILPEVK